MEWAFIEVGGPVAVAARDPRGVLLQHLAPASRPIRLVPAGDLFVIEETDEPTRNTNWAGHRLPPTPFARTSLGSNKSRLAWPNGATAISRYTHIAGWGERFAIVLDERGFSVIDAESDRIVRVALSPDVVRWSNIDPVSSADRMWIAANDGTYDGVVAIPTAMLEGLATGTVDVGIARHFPTYKTVQARTSHTAKVTTSRAKDPTGVAKATPSDSLPTRSTEDIGRLIAAVLANPSDDDQRAVLADALIELGDPSAEAIAKVRAGKVSPANVKEALGPLGPYLTKVELVGGFPVEASLSQNAPDARQHAEALEAACADFRLAMIHTLHAYRGWRASPTTYARLVGSPNARGLRRVDASDLAVIDALIHSDNDQVTYLENVNFAEEEWMEKLATRTTFERVATVHTVVGTSHLQPLVNQLAKDKSGFFKRVPRRLVLEETMKRNEELLTMLGRHWSKLPVAALTVGGVTIERGGKITGDDTKLVAVAKSAFG